jgi:hypothetical protein
MKNHSSDTTTTSSTNDNRSTSASDITSISSSTAWCNRIYKPFSMINIFISNFKMLINMANNHTNSYNNANTINSSSNSGSSISDDGICDWIYLLQFSKILLIKLYISVNNVIISLLDFKSKKITKDN